ncbi:MAG: zinc chelation protein SecC, partial [Acidobacteriota bacterium]|nr:zinc chelation protein SecC [Acidobacteriota bacterium]
MSCRTPRKITDDVQEFCREVAEGGEPVYLEVVPSHQDIPLDCFINVEKRVSEYGGSVQHGWRIWEWPHTMIEAEFHAVWLAPDDMLVDVTPAPKGVTRVLFLPDSSRVYEGRQVNNIRKPLSK